MKFWWVGSIAAFVCPGLTTGWVYRSTVAVFDTDTCSEPASLLAYSRNNGNCVSSQSDHYNPICESNSVSHSVTDCTWYSVGGGDFIGLLQEYFGYSTPFLIVEEYLPMWTGDCGGNYWWEQDNYLGEVMVYRLDQVCHKNRDGSMSTKLTLDKTLTITKYNDPDCNSEASKKEVTWTMATQNPCTDNTKFYLIRASLSMVAVATFDDMDCTTKPTKVTFSHHFGCTATQGAAKSVCGPNGPTQYSTSSCTNDHFEFTNSVFGESKPYLVVEKFSYTNCGVLDSVSVYAADGLCHSNVDDGTSFLVSISTEGSGTILKYSDANCRQLSETVEVTKRMVGAYSCVQDTGCGSPNGCSQRFSVGGMGGPSARGKMTAIAVYTNDDCTQPPATMTFTRKLVCTPQLMFWDPVCENTEAVHFVSDCTEYNAGGWDSSGLLTQASKYWQYAFLLVEEFEQFSCGVNDALVSVTAYFLSDECHTNYEGTASTKLLFGDSLKIIKYGDLYCTLKLSETEVTFDMARFGVCVGDTTRFLLRGTPDLTVVGLFKDSSCSGQPIKLAFTQQFGCVGERTLSESACTSDGLDHYSVMGCSHDYMELTAATLGDSTPYLVVEEFSDASCNERQNVTVYIADGICHSDINGTTSFMATITKEGSAIITTYLDSSCTMVDDNTHVAKRQLSVPYTCYPSNECGVNGALCSKRISFGGLGGQPSNGRMTLSAVYDDSSCSQPAALVRFTRDLVCTPQGNSWNPVCKTTDALNEISDCTYYWGGGFDWFDSLNRAFGWSATYLLVEKYDTALGYCGDNNALDSAIAFHLDENCHVNHGGLTSTKLSLEHPLTITDYGDPNCTNISSKTDVTWMAATQSPCLITSTTATRVFLRGQLPELTAVAVYKDSGCSENPVSLTFSQNFVCEANYHPEMAVCKADGTDLYSVSRCTYDYAGLVDSAFGMKTPYIMVEKFYDSWCGQVGNVTVYVADGNCHSSSDGTTSFKVTITSKGSATITTYSDSACTIVDENEELSKRFLSSYSCSQDAGCFNDGYGCSTRISVGGLTAPSSKGKMTMVTTYDNTGCSEPPKVMEFTRELTCTPQIDHWNPMCEINVTTSTRSDCMRYYRGGWDEYNSVERQFGWWWQNPIIVVEEYDGGWEDANLDNASVYRLDEACTMNHDGQTSTKLTLGLSVTIATYDDSNCSVVSTQKQISWADTQDQRFNNGRVSYFRGFFPALTSVAVFDDKSCSEKPAKLEITQQFSCKPSVDYAQATCEPANKKYSVSSCTRNQFEVVNTVFGFEKPYVMVQEYSDWWCGRIENVTVYAADGACHSDIVGNTSFRVTLASGSSATITTYVDAVCKKVRDNAKVRSEIFTYACVGNNVCADATGHGCSRRYSVGGLGGSPAFGEMTAVTNYRDSSCSQPAVALSVTRELVCNPKSNDKASMCTEDGVAYSTSHCINTTDASNIYRLLDDSFGWRSHVVVEEYDTSLGGCGEQKALAGVAAYLLDEECHANNVGNTSSKLTLGKSLTITKYEDSYCSAISSQTEVTWSMVKYGACMADNTKFYLRGPMPDLTAIAVFSDVSCSNSPVKLTFTQLFGCSAGLDSLKPVCKAEVPGLYSISSCIRDYANRTAATFGTETPYVIEEEYADTWCGQLISSTVYLADGSCHTNTDGATSFMVTITEGSRATIVTYRDKRCRKVQVRNSVSVGSSNFVGSSGSCSASTCTDTGGSGCSKKFLVGGLKGSESISSRVFAIHTNNSCSDVPGQLIVSDQLECSSVGGSACEEVSVDENLVYQTHDCTDDIVAFTTSTFGSTPYVIMKKYVTGTNCESLEASVIFNADGRCHYSVTDSASFRILPNIGGSLTFATYPTAFCHDSDADYIMVGPKYINTDICFNGNLRLYANMTALPSTAVSSPTPIPSQLPPVDDVDYLTREAIMFPAWVWEPSSRRIFVTD